MFSLIKVIVIMIIYLLLSISAYILYLEKNPIPNAIIELIILAFFYLIASMLLANNIQKKGLIVGVISSIILFFMLKVIILLAGNGFSFNILSFLISIFSGAIGGILGINFKKVI